MKFGLGLTLLVSSVIAIGMVTASCPTVDLGDTQAVIQSLNLQLSCGSTNITTTINTCVLEQMGYNATDDISIAGIQNPGVEEGKICSLIETREGNDLYLTMTNFSACRTTHSNSSDAIWYYNAVRTVQFSDIMEVGIRRAKSIHLPSACRYNKSGIAELGGYSTDDGGVAVIDLQNGVSASGLSMEICFDLECSDGPIQDGDEIGAGDVLYLIGQSSSAFPIEIVGLWATTVPNPEGASPYYIAENGCPLDFTTTVVSMEPNEVHARFIMFDWVGDDDTTVYIHGSIELCDPGEQSCLQPVCDEPMRERRAVGSGSQKHHVQSVTFSLRLRGKSTPVTASDAQP